MGKLVDGKWQEDNVAGGSPSGRFVRARSRFRRFVQAAADAQFPAARGRYHLYIAHACPWAHRVMIVRTLKRLQDAISFSVVDPFMGPEGWHFEEGADAVNGARLLREVYLQADAGYSGRVTVPVLWDKEQATVVSNESSEIIRMLNSEFDALGADSAVDLYPEALRDEIDAVNDRVYEAVNNGVYKCGFASSQEAYDEALDALFDELERLEEHLTRHRWLAGGVFTEADVRLFTTLARFDPVYVTHFKCNKKRLADYPALLGHTREVYQLPGVRETFVLDEVRSHYYRSHESINPRRIIAGGFELDLDAPHGREHLA
jgi:putative glutathione S-transferase